MKEIIENKNFNSHNLATVRHDSGSKNIVIFCHGYRSSNIGPNRFFVRAARKLAEKGISSFRFDQYGSGNSKGDFIDSSFEDWIKTTEEICKFFLNDGCQVSLLGQSMGASAVIAVGAKIPELASIVAWVPDPNIEDFTPPESGLIEEGGQIIKPSFWKEAHDAKISEKLSLVKAPVYVTQCTNDEYVDRQNRDAISENIQPHHLIDNFDGYSHSQWSYKQSEEIINKSIDFLVANFRK